jgi:uridine kinase
VDLPDRLGAAVTTVSRQHQRVVVAIDGPDGAGKTTLADELAGRLSIPTVRTSIDGFHQARELRYQRGELSAPGYYLDSFDYPTLLDECLQPFLRGASRLRTVAYDHRGDFARSVDEVTVPAAAVLVIDGVFLLRPELRDLWMLSVYLRVSAEETLRRAQRRDLELFGSADEVRRRYLGRYLPGQSLYRQQADPEGVADVLVDNERPQEPVVERWNIPG